jgi:hypothetical protein
MFILTFSRLISSGSKIPFENQLYSNTKRIPIAIIQGLIPLIVHNGKDNK